LNGIFFGKERGDAKAFLKGELSAKLTKRFTKPINLSVCPLGSHLP